MPKLAFKTTESPKQNVGEPINVIVLLGNGLTVTEATVEVCEQPLLSVIIAAYDPEDVAV